MNEKLYRVQMNSKGMPNFNTAVEVADLPTIEVEGGNLEDAILLTKDAYSDLCLRASQVSEACTNGYKDGQKDMAVFLLEGMKNALANYGD